jgi:hypothetical protein
MIGKEPAFENREDSEQQLARLLKEKGVEDQETREMLRNWTLEQEKIVDESADRFTASIQFNVKRARLYFDAGFLDESFESFEDAATQALNEQRFDLYQEIINEMDVKEKSLE